MTPRKEKINNGNISKEHKAKVLTFSQYKVTTSHNKNTTPKKEK